MQKNNKPLTPPSPPSPIITPCCILLCERPASVYIVLDNVYVNFGALGEQQIKVPLCKFHEDKAWNEQYLMEQLMK